MEEKRRRGEPAPVVAPASSTPLQKIVLASLAWLTYPTRGRVGLCPWIRLGLRPETTIIGSSSTFATVQSLDPPLQPDRYCNGLC